MTILKYDGTLAAVTEAAAAAQYSTALAETLSGSAVADSLWGGEGDLLQGGAGNDTYTLGSLKVRVVEHDGQGVDKLVTWADVSLDKYGSIENLQVGGDGRYAAGNAGDNVIEGDNASQQLFGGLGQDVLIGGGGADTFIIIKGQGNDVIQDFGADDTVRLSSGYTSFAEVQAHLSQVGSDVKLDLGDGAGLLFRNITTGQFSGANFQLQLDMSKLGALTFSDEFSGPLSLWDRESNPAGLWRPDYGFGGSQGAGSYTLANNGEKQIYTSPYFRDHAGDFAESPFVSNADGTLSIWGKASTNPEIFGYGYTSGALTTAPTFSQKYGYFEMKADLPDTAGAWPAFWLVAADGTWPPELDVMETLTGDVRGAHTTVHSGVGGVHTQSGYTAFIPDTANGFHTYGTLWTATELVWYIDGVEVFRAATPADMQKPMYMIANLALGGWAGAITDADVPAEFKIDYIRAYSIDGTVLSQPAITAPAPLAPTAPSGGGLVLTASEAGESVTGGEGDDKIFASHSANVLTGGAGADTFVFPSLPWSAGRITDFTVGVDKLDLSALYAGGYTGSDPVADGYLSFADNGSGGTRVMLDIDARGTANPWPYQIVVLDGVASGGLTAAQVLGGGAAAPTPVPTPTPTTTATTTPAEPAPVLTLPVSAAPTQTFTGNRGANSLTGTVGADLIDGGKGADTLTGGGGDDTYVVDNSGDVVVETALGGVDTVKTALSSYTLAGEVENLTLTGAAQKGVGNILSNILAAGAGGSTLDGADGADILIAGGGSDVLTGGAGADVFRFNTLDAGADRITDFVPGVDKLDLRGLLAGYPGANPIADGYVSFSSDGAGGVKVMVDPDAAGAAGASQIAVLSGASVASVSAAEVLVGYAASTTPAVPVTPTPAPTPVEAPPVLTLPVSATPTQTFTGNGGGNRLNGTAGADLLDGGQGSDTLKGGLGDDTYVVDNTGDKVVENAASGIDTVRTTLASYTLDNELENLVLTGSGQRGVGNDTSNILTAGTGGSTLDGAGGADILIAGGGADVLTGGGGADVFRFNSLGTGVDRITDFVAGTDKLDLRGLLQGYAGANPIADGWVAFQAASGGVDLLVDLDGVAGGHSLVKLVTLSGVSGALAAQTDWVFH